MRLIKPNSYNLLSEKSHNKICNGTGAEGTPKWLCTFLDSFDGLGTNIREASNIHDYCYFLFISYKEKILADLIYFTNILLIYIYQIFKLPMKEALGGLCVLPFGIVRAILNTSAVLLFGKKAFYNK